MVGLLGTLLVLLGLYLMQHIGVLALPICGAGAMLFTQRNQMDFEAAFGMLGLLCMVLFVLASILNL